jgi:phospholipid/cholesterol/gamma-HCH transport system permease protein
MSEFFEIEGESIFLLGDWRLANLETISQQMERESQLWHSADSFDGSRLHQIDTAGAMVLLRTIEKLRVSSDKPSFVGFSSSQTNILSLAQNSLEAVSPLRKREYGFLEKVGRDARSFFDTVCSILGFIGMTTSELFRLLFTPGSLRLKELFVQLEQVGLNAIPICALITFLIGIVIAYLTGIQLERYGANIFIVEGVGIAMCRELSPILVAVIVAGRSGSAFTAQLGTMKLNEEIDALDTLGLSPLRVLVVPRILALMLAFPFLVFFGDIFGILGGMLVADFRLDVTGATFLQRLQVALPLKHVYVGLVKAPVFAYFIAIIGCRMGLGVENNARSIGIKTTQTVVRSIVAVILINAAFAVLLSEFGI